VGVGGRKWTWGTVHAMNKHPYGGTAVMRHTSSVDLMILNVSCSDHSVDDDFLKRKL